MSLAESVQPNLMFVSEASNLPLWGAPDKALYLGRLWLTPRYKIMLERIAKVKHCSFFVSFVSYKEKSFYNIRPTRQSNETFVFSNSDEAK